MATVQYHNAFGAPVSKKFVQKIFSVCYRLAHIPHVTLTYVAIVGNKEIQRLNRMYRNKNAPTDVLSFRSAESPEKIPGEPLSLGEIIISYPVALKQAKKFGHPVTQEIRMLLIHGFAHLVGYDHKTRREKDIMRRFEKKIFDTLIKRK